MTEADELIGNGDESGEWRLLLAELAATRQWSQPLAAGSSGPR